MTDSPDAQWVCRSCKAVSLGRQVLAFETGAARSCPRCKLIGHMDMLCDAPGCMHAAVCRISGPAGQDHVRCLDHFELGDRS
jgi:hypothetical protein